jgi:hypothetical protein
MVLAIRFLELIYVVRNIADARGDGADRRGVAQGPQAGMVKRVW